MSPPVANAALRHLLGRQPDTRALVAAIAEALGDAITIEDSDGRLLQGAAQGSPATRHLVRHEGVDLGWVTGGEQARVVAALLDHLVLKEAERKALGAEVLHLYREVNLIYSFSEKLTALLDLDRVAQLTLQEARHLIVASDGAILLVDEGLGTLSAVAAFGDAFPLQSRVGLGVGIVGAIAVSGIGEIVDDVDADPRRVDDGSSLCSLVCAPLKVGDKVIGAIALGSTVPKPYAAAELKLLNTLALQTATAIENARLFERTVEAARERERLMALHQRTEVARAKLESELEFAARIQADLFPAELPHLAGYDLAARNRPARQCGGDYYDARVVRGAGPHDEREDARVLLCVADVSGKGLPAALVMSNMQATLRALLGRTTSLTDLAVRASDLLYDTTAPEKYVTAALLELTPATGAARFVGAGHLDNVVVRADGDVLSLCSTGAPLGLLPPGLPYELTEFTIEPGDCLVLYSDGVTDAQNEADEEFGEPRLIDLLRRLATKLALAPAPADLVIARVFEAIDAFVGDAPQFDDITMLVLRRLR